MGRRGWPGPGDRFCSSDLLFPLLQEQGLYHRLSTAGHRLRHGHHVLHVRVQDQHPGQGSRIWVQSMVTTTPRVSGSPSLRSCSLSSALSPPGASTFMRPTRTSVLSKARLSFEPFGLLASAVCACVCVLMESYISWDGVLHFSGLGCTPTNRCN